MGFNKAWIVGNAGFIEVCGHYGTRYVEIDAADLLRLRALGARWCLSSQRGYLMTQVCGKTTYLHRFLLDAPPGQTVDHIDGNPLNNRRSNLRLATQKENSRNKGPSKNNTSGYKGVRLHRASGLWHAAIKVDRRTHSLKYHLTPEAAAQAYNAAAIAYFGEFAKLNEIPAVRPESA